MEVVRQLNYRYLWVDRYYIYQHNQFNVEHQISEMANIYGHATVTICALGSNDQIGLPGISLPRKRQPSFFAQGCRCFWCPFPGLMVDAYISPSQWARRGWTFQEALLSQRCLFFTDEEAFMLCQSRSRHEGLFIPPLPFGCKSLWALKGPTMFGKQSARYTDKFIAEADEYMRRELTYDVDTIDAFRGVLSTSPMVSYWGVPILSAPPESHYKSRYLSGDSRDCYGATTAEEGFAYGLLWRPYRSSNAVANSVRRSCPSWSYLSRRRIKVEFPAQFTGVLNTYDSSMYYSPSYTFFVPEIWPVNEQEGGENLGEIYERQPLSMKVLRERSVYLNIPTVTATWQLSHEPGAQSIVEGVSVTFKSISDKTIEACLKNKGTHCPDYSIETTWLESDGNDKALSFHEGRSNLAISLLVSRVRCDLKTHWLALEQEHDDTFRRVGTIEWSAAESLSEYRPKRRSLTWIRLS